MAFNEPTQEVKLKEIQLKPGTSVAEQVAQMPEETVNQILKQAGDYADYMKYTGLMNHIAEEMREIPYIPSEQPSKTDTSALLKVEFPNEGGVLTYMQKYRTPYKGYPHHEFVEKIDIIKKLNRAMLSGLYHQLKRYNKVKFLTLLPGLWVAKDAIRAWVHAFDRTVERFRIKPKRYCTFIRELHGSFPEGEFEGKIRDLLCMILEFDNAYRFRAQDVLSELSKVSLVKNPIKELVRLIDLLRSREKTQEISDTWTLVRSLLKYYLMFDRKLLKIIQVALLRIDLDEVKLTDEDKTYCIPRTDYRFGFMANPTEKDSELIELRKLDDELNSRLQVIRKESSEAHEMEKKNGNSLEKITELDSKYQDMMDKEIEKHKERENKILATVMN